MRDDLALVDPEAGKVAKDYGENQAAAGHANQRIARLVKTCRFGF